MVRKPQGCGSKSTHCVTVEISEPLSKNLERGEDVVEQWWGLEDSVSMDLTGAHAEV